MSKTVHTVALIGHLVGLVLGFGGAVLTDIIFIKCVRASRVGRTLLLVMKTASNLVIVGYLLLVASGIALVSSGSTISPKFWAKMVVVLIIGVNGTVAHRVVFPQIDRRVRSRIPNITIGFLHQISVVAAVSGVSWVTATVLGAWKGIHWPITVWMLLYAFTLLTAVCVSLLITPVALHVDHPEFEEVFPTLAARAHRASMVYPRRQLELPPPGVPQDPNQGETP